MTSYTDIFGARTVRKAAMEEVVGVLLGAGFTFALFFGMAHFENYGQETAPSEIEDMRQVSTPYEPPPPPPKSTEQVATAVAELPFAGLEIGTSDSPVAIAVVPPDLESIIPTTTNPPRAKIQFGHLITDLKPKMEIEVDQNRIYQDTEVDQLPRGVVRATPNIPRDVRNNARTLRVILLLQIDQKGRAENTRIVQSSGNAKFDHIVARTVKEEWLFSPAIRRGKKVKVLAQQAFRVNFSSASPFEAR